MQQQTQQLDQNQIHYENANAFELYSKQQTKGISPSPYIFINAHQLKAIIAVNLLVNRRQ